METKNCVSNKSTENNGQFDSAYNFDELEPSGRGVFHSRDPAHYFRIGEEEESPSSDPGNHQRERLYLRDQVYSLRSFRVQWSHQVPQAPNVIINPFVAGVIRICQIRRNESRPALSPVPSSRDLTWVFEVEFPS